MEEGNKKNTYMRNFMKSFVSMISIKSTTIWGTREHSPIPSNAITSSKSNHLHAHDTRLCIEMITISMLTPSVFDKTPLDW